MTTTDELVVTEFIKDHPECSYYDIVEGLPHSPSTINKILMKLKKQKKIEIVEVPGRKSKGWRKC